MAFIFCADYSPDIKKKYSCGMPLCQKLLLYIKNTGLASFNVLVYPFWNKLITGVTWMLVDRRTLIAYKSFAQFYNNTYITFFFLIHLYILGGDQAQDHCKVKKKSKKVY